MARGRDWCSGFFNLMTHLVTFFPSPAFPTEASEIMKSIGEAIQYLHSINIAHRDVKVPAVRYAPRTPQLRCCRGPWGLSEPGKGCQSRPASLLPGFWGRLGQDATLLCRAALSGQTPAVKPPAAQHHGPPTLPLSAMAPRSAPWPLAQRRTLGFSVLVVFLAGSLHPSLISKDTESSGKAASWTCISRVAHCVQITGARHGLLAEKGRKVSLFF